ncbi:MAG: dihydroorotate dehydrogenase [Rhizobiales bacterium]|nr:dihydroorotate dehydrogenase [Hyphomicrobiales bacterium]OJY43694.1 MAG: dihydroorotate dehydrogenase B catalytic subunit [Rhizobiales bacterium 64-17]
MPAPNLRVTIAGIEMKNPLTVGSGTYGHHGNFSQFFPVETMGVLVPKTVRNYKWPGNPGPRVLETTAGLHSSVGIPCNTWEHFVAHDVPILKTLKLPIIQSVIGRTEDEYVEIVERCDSLNVFAGIELNLSCPNLKQGGLDFGYDPDSAYKLVRHVRSKTRLPVIAKLAPDYTSLLKVAKSVEAAGADAISMINAPRAMCIDHVTRKPMIGNKIGALSGAAIKPLAVYMVWEVYRAVQIPIFGMGGVTDFRDVIEFMAAGARAVGFGTINYVDPMALPRALGELTRFLEENGIADVNELVGSAHEDRPALVVPERVVA